MCLHLFNITDLIGIQVLAEVTSDDIRQSVSVESVSGECLLVSLIARVYNLTKSIERQLPL